MLADVIYEQGADSTAVVSRGDGAIALLTSSIPDLCLNRLGVDLNGTSSELDTDSRLGVQIELVSGESTQQVGLSDAGVSNQHH